MKDYINSNYGTNSAHSRHYQNMTESEILAESFSSKANRTRVYSGNTKSRSQIPSLFNMCIRVLQENIEYLECTGGVPFDLLKPVLEIAKPEQLANIEYYNPYLLEDSDVLWRPHCQRKWKNKLPQELESWREMYERCTNEDEEKLNRLTKHIKHNQAVTSSGIQKTKMAYMDTMVKPPRNVMRKQDQFGTSSKLVVSPAARTVGLKHLAPNLAARGDVRLRVQAGLRDDAQQGEKILMKILSINLINKILLFQQ
jgi:transcription elongation factor B polypeptide 3